MSILSVEHLSLSIGEHQILQHVNFSVAEGEVVGLIGPNGSGKTTLFNVLSGFLLPTSGTVKLRGQDITHLPPAKRAQAGIGRVFQNFGIFREMTLEENVFVGTGAKILGPVTIGANARIGANAVVLTDVPAGATAVGAPARVIEDAATAK